MSLAAAVAAAAVIYAVPAGPPGSAELAVPARIEAPHRWTPRIGQAPLAAASVLVGGTMTPVVNIAEEYTAAAVSADGAYRLQEFDESERPGETLLLSPDGTRYAATDGLGNLVVVGFDGERVLPVRTEESGSFIPLAWSRDGTFLVVDNIQADDTLGIVQLSDGVFRPLASPGGEWWRDMALGVALSPTGDRLAYQAGTEIAVVRVEDGVRLGVFRLPPGERLAGRGAWTPDGAALMIGSPSGADWRFHGVSPADGTPVAGRPLPRLDGAAAGRVLGWRPDGSVVAVAYEAAVSDDPDFTAFEALAGIRVVTLTPDELRERPFLDVPPGIRAVDIAAGALATTAPPVEAPLWPPARAWSLAATLLLIAAAGFTTSVQRRRRLAPPES